MGTQKSDGVILDNEQVASTTTNVHDLEAARALLMPALLQQQKADPTAAAVVKEQISETLMSVQETPTFRRPRSDSAGLDALAALATQELPATAAAVTCSSASSSDTDEGDLLLSVSKQPVGSPSTQPHQRRPRSVSNPEGFEKYCMEESDDEDEAGVQKSESHPSCFVLPESFLEVELEKASAAVREQKERRDRPRRRTRLPSRLMSLHEEEDQVTQLEQVEKTAVESDEVDQEEEEEDEDEENLDADELVRRARSRLLEDLSSEVNDEKGEILLPHTLSKYKKIYSQNGRIGIYSPVERAAIIARFHSKRSRRMWKKKIRYNCRKSLADRRLRVKGRFIKRAEQEELAKELAKEERQKGRDRKKKSANDDDDASGVFRPTEDMPYRRLRRHTVT